MMTFILVFLVIIYVFVCLFLIVVILGQEGKGGGLSGLLGASALGETLGASTAESVLRRWTRNCAILFIVLSLCLTIVGSRVFTRSILDGATGVEPTEETRLPEETIELPTTPSATTTDTGRPVDRSAAEPAAKGPVERPPAAGSTSPSAGAAEKQQVGGVKSPADRSPGLSAGPTSPAR